MNVEPRGPSSPRIRLLTEADVEAYVGFRRRSLIEAPLAFASSPDYDFMGSPEAVREQIARGDESVIFGAFVRPNAAADPATDSAAGTLVGAVGTYREERPKARHRMHIWGAYVTPEHRRRGLGRQLLEMAISHAGRLDGVTCVYLGVTSSAPEARRLYERAGFETWGAEPEALRHAGETATEYHMFRRV